MRKLLCLVSIFMISSPALAAKDLSSPPARILLDDSIEGSRGVGTYGTGFEAAEGFGLGPVEPQNGWGSNGVNLPWSSVSDANPASGTQHLRLVKDTVTSPTPASRLVRSPDISPGGALVSDINISMDLNISGSGGSDYDVCPGRIQGPYFYFSLYVKFYYYDYDLDGNSGEVFILDDLTGLGGGDNTFVLPTDPNDPTSALEYTEGAYANLTIDADFPGDSIDYYYGGVFIYNGNRPFGDTDGGGVQQWGMRHDQFQGFGYDTGADVDNLNITPEPATLCLLALGGLAALRKRR